MVIVELKSVLACSELVLNDQSESVAFADGENVDAFVLTPHDQIVEHDLFEVCRQLRTSFDQELEDEPRELVAEPVTAIWTQQVCDEIRVLEFCSA